MKELVFEVTQEEDGGYCAECLPENIFTQSDTWEDLRQNVQEAVRAYFFDQPQTSRRIRLRFVHDEIIPGACLS
jgi:predicted RNase H-like HicB family nuclease